MTRLLLSLILLAVLTLGAADAPAQSVPGITPPAMEKRGDEVPEPEAVPEGPKDAFNRETPLTSMLAFMKAAEAFEWDVASNYLDLRNLPSDVSRMSGAELAEAFYFVVSRRQVKINENSISNSPLGQAIDDLPEYRDELGRIKTNAGDVKLLLQRVPGPDGLMIWKVSNITVAKIPELYEEFSYPVWVETLREALPYHQLILGFELYKWIIMAIVALVLIPVGLVLAYLLARIVSSPKSPIWREVRNLLMGPVVALCVLAYMNDLMLELGVGYTASKIMQANTLLTAFIIWFIWDAVNIWRARRRYRYEAEGRGDAAVLGRPVANAIKLVTLLIGILVWLANAGVDISALLAGLGIGGIAVALALQKPIEDLFGAISIYSQQPVNTGDMCRYGDSIGRVEEIGLRTTRIRTLSNSVVNVPNATLSTGIIENLTARTKIMYQPDLPVRYDTSRAQLQQVLKDLEDMLVANERIENSTIRVRLREFSPDAIIIRIRAFALTRSIETYLEIVQEVNLDIMKIMDDNQVRFSQGAQTLFIKRDEAEGHPFKPAAPESTPA